MKDCTSRAEGGLADVETTEEGEEAEAGDEDEGDRDVVLAHTPDAADSCFLDFGLVGDAGLVSYPSQKPCHLRHRAHEGLASSHLTWRFLVHKGEYGFSLSGTVTS